VVNITENIDFGRITHHQAADPLIQPEISSQVVHGGAAGLVGDRGALDSPRPKHQVEENGQVGEEKQGHHPGDSALAGPAVHDDVENEQDAHTVKDQWNQQQPVFKGDLCHGHDDDAFFSVGKDKKIIVDVQQPGLGPTDCYSF
jgi:hypothetical protein